MADDAPTLSEAEKEFASKYDTKNMTMIGEGAQGRIFRIKKFEDEKEYAVKVIETKDPVSLLLEYSVQMKAENDCTLQTYEYYLMDEAVVIVMDLLQGRDLSHFYEDYKDLNREKYERMCLSVFTQVAECITIMHRRGIAHRDIKLENILYNQETGIAKLIDFGLAIDPKINPQTIDVLSGTSLYMSPLYLNAYELVRINMKVLYYQDYWALCVLLYELLYNKPPFLSDSREEIFSMILNRRETYVSIGETPPTSVLNELFSGKTDDVIMTVDKLKNLSKNFEE